MFHVLLTCFLVCVTNAGEHQQGLEKVLDGLTLEVEIKLDPSKSYTGIFIERRYVFTVVDATVLEHIDELVAETFAITSKPEIIVTDVIKEKSEDIKALIVLVTDLKVQNNHRLTLPLWKSNIDDQQFIYLPKRDKGSKIISLTNGITPDGKLPDTFEENFDFRGALIFSTDGEKKNVLLALLYHPNEQSSARLTVISTMSEPVLQFITPTVKPWNNASILNNENLTKQREDICSAIKEDNELEPEVNSEHIRVERVRSKAPQLVQPLISISKQSTLIRHCRVLGDIIVSEMTKILSIAFDNSTHSISLIQNEINIELDKMLTNFASQYESIVELSQTHIPLLLDIVSVITKDSNLKELIMYPLRVINKTAIKETVYENLMKNKDIIKGKNSTEDLKLNQFKVIVYRLIQSVMEMGQFGTNGKFAYITHFIGNIELNLFINGQCELVANELKENSYAKILEDPKFQMLFCDTFTSYLHNNVLGALISLALGEVRHKRMPAGTRPQIRQIINSKLIFFAQNVKLQKSIDRQLKVISQVEQATPATKYLKLLVQLQQIIIQKIAEVCQYDELITAIIDQVSSLQPGGQTTQDKQISKLEELTSLIHYTTVMPELIERQQSTLTSVLDIIVNQERIDNLLIQNYKYDYQKFISPQLVLLKRTIEFQILTGTQREYISMNATLSELTVKYLAWVSASLELLGRCFIKDDTYITMCQQLTAIKKISASQEIIRTELVLLSNRKMYLVTEESELKNFAHLHDEYLKISDLLERIDLFMEHNEMRQLLNSQLVIVEIQHQNKSYMYFGIASQNEVLTVIDTMTPDLRNVGVRNLNGTRFPVKDSLPIRTNETKQMMVFTTNVKLNECYGGVFEYRYPTEKELAFARKERDLVKVFVEEDTNITIDEGSTYTKDSLNGTLAVPIVTINITRGTLKLLGFIGKYQLNEEETNRYDIYRRNILFKHYKATADTCEDVKNYNLKNSMEISLHNNYNAKCSYIGHLLNRQAVFTVIDYDKMKLLENKTLQIRINEDSRIKVVALLKYKYSEKYYLTILATQNDIVSSFKSFLGSNGFWQHANYFGYSYCKNGHALVKFQVQYLQDGVAQITAIGFLKCGAAVLAYEENEIKLVGLVMKPPAAKDVSMDTSIDLSNVTVKKFLALASNIKEYLEEKTYSGSPLFSAQFLA